MKTTVQPSLNNSVVGNIVNLGGGPVRVTLGDPVGCREGPGPDGQMYTRGPLHPRGKHLPGYARRWRRVYRNLKDTAAEEAPTARALKAALVTVPRALTETIRAAEAHVKAWPAEVQRLRARMSESWGSCQFGAPTTPENRAHRKHFRRLARARARALEQYRSACAQVHFLRDVLALYGGR